MPLPQRLLQMDATRGVIRRPDGADRQVELLLGPDVNTGRRDNLPGVREALVDPDEVFKYN